MFKAILNIFKIKELRNKVLFTLAMLAVYRIGHWIPLPGVDQSALASFFQEATTGENVSAFGRAATFVGVFSGGSFGQSTIFGLGILPYISASIIFQLLSSVSPRMKALQNEGPTGRQKIQEWTRLATIGLCIIQGFGWLQFISRSGMVYSEWAANPVWWVMAIAALTAGCMFLMWLSEQIDKYGIGNGVSLIIAAGILVAMPNAFLWIIDNSPIRKLQVTQWIFGPVEPGASTNMSWFGVLLILAGFIAVVGGSVLMTVAQRRIPIQQAKHTRGTKVFGGQRSYLPLRVNHGGVMPVIFASSLMIFPSIIFGAVYQSMQGSPGWTQDIFRWLNDNFQMGAFPYVICEIVLIYFFAYFWITVQFNPQEMSKQLRDHGSFIPGLRPGPRTEEYLEAVMERITYVGAGFLAIIAVTPMVVNRALNVDFAVAQFLGGTGLLIVVSVVLDFIQRVEANLLMRNYAGFLGGGEEGGPAIRGPR
jgi:preprotein translocase subunit SecY